MNLKEKEKSMGLSAAEIEGANSRLSKLFGSKGKDKDKPAKEKEKSKSS